MKILCPTDFSSTSVAACRWAIKLLDSLGGGSLQLLHCMNVVSRSAIFVKADDIFRERAEEDLKAMQQELSELSERVQIEAYVVNLDPKSFVPDYAERKGYDLIVMGTKGLTALKDMTVGSVTAHLMDRSSVPVLTIPAEAEFTGLRQIILGVDSHRVQPDTLEPLKALLASSKAQLVAVHTTPEDGLAIDYDPFLNLPLEQIRYEFFTIPQGDSIPASLTAFCQERGADLLAMVHRQRSWLERLLNNSVVKSNLFQIQTPLLILPE
jgi:nucleotide-binding universal stress UspA family protein